MSAGRTPTSVHAGTVPDTAAVTTGLDGLVSMAPYADPVLRGLLQAYKYEGIAEAGEALGAVFAAWLTQHERALAELVGGAIGAEVGIIPSPMHPLRQRMRGFNQADRFAALVAGVLGAPPLTVDGSLLRRAYARKTQVETGEDAAARAANVRGVIRATRQVPGTCVLVDDVATSGATLVACAEALRAAGAQRVVAVTVLTG